jgi:hypothetical protein
MRGSLRLSPKLRWLYYYPVAVAGAQVNLCRSDAYRAVRDGSIPVIRHGKLLMVPKEKWDPIAKQLRAQMRAAEKLRAAQLKRAEPSKAEVVTEARKVEEIEAAADA